MKYRARANGEVRRLTPSEVAALVPHIYEPIEEDETLEASEPARDSSLLTPEAPLATTAIQQPQKRGKGRR